MADFLMPALGADMETGKLVQWLVQPGSRVKRGDVVAVVETQKGAIDVEIFLDGVIEDLVPLGAQLPVGSLLARVREESSADALQVASPAAAPIAPPLPTPPPLPTTAPTPEPTPVPVPTPAPVPPPVMQAMHGAAAARERIKASPAARRRAQELGIDVEHLQGAGPEGSILIADVERAAARELPQARPMAPATGTQRGRFDPAQMRAAIAAAMGRSKREIPHYYLMQDVDFGAASGWLEDHNANRAPAERLLPAVLLLKATARALVQVPQLNGFYENGAVRLATGIHLGWAISLRGGGLVAPAIHDADRKTLPELMTALRDLVQRARTGGLRSSELSDPTITVTSLGERGADSVIGVIYPPQLAIVGFGRVIQRPWVVDGQVLARPVVNLSLAADHRGSDGHVGGLLLAAIDHALQQPETL